MPADVNTIHRILATLGLTGTLALAVAPASAADTASPEAPAASASSAEALPAALEPDMKLPGKTFVVDVDGFELRLTAFPQDALRAYFQGRGFSSANSDLIAQSCVFQTIMRNTAPLADNTAIDIDLNRWHSIADPTEPTADETGTPKPPKLRADWNTLWLDAGISTASRVAFKWSLFPTEQRYFPGDYNWGMISFNEPPGGEFDLELSWTHAGSEHQHTLRRLRCAAE